MATTHAKSSFSLWTKHYRKQRLVNRKPPINDGGAPILSDKSDKSDRSDNAPHQTLRQNQTAIQYWGAEVSVIR